MKMLIEKLKNPDREFGPIPFWFLNDTFSDDEIIRQLNDFNEKGVSGVVLHPRIGIPKSIEYLSDEFMHYIEVAVKTAASLSMKVVLYDEAMYPSGSAHGKVVAENSDFASQGIYLEDDYKEGKLITKTKSGKYIVQKPSGGTIRGIHWGEDDGEENAPKAADLLSKASVDTFIRLTHDRYYNLLKEYFGNTIIGFFTDEPELLGRIYKPKCRVWTWDFEKVIEENGGVLSDLEGLFTGEENETVLLYKRLVFERECEIYYKSLSEWCKAHNIALMGHPHFADDIECERFFDIPGQDLVLRRVAPETGGLTGNESAQAKCSADAARLLGARRNSNECYGACSRSDIPWYFTGADLKWMTDWLGVRGVNMFIPHAFYYSVRGNRKDERPPDVGPNNIWWEHFETISTYIKRISYIMTDSHNTAKVCVMCENQNMPTDAISWLYENQIEFNYVPYNFVMENSYRDGKLYIGNNVYEYICNDYKNMFPEMKKVESIEDISYRDIYTKDAVKDLRVSSIIKDNIRMWFLTNEGENDIKTKACIKGFDKLIKMDLWSGDIKAVHISDSYFNVKLKKRESMLLIAGEGDFPHDTEKDFAKIDFKLVSEDKENYVKYYEGDYSGAKDNLYISILADEMVECFVNDNFAGFSIWNEHEFYISPYMVLDNVNKIKLKVFGNAANKFSDYTIEYGIRRDNK